MANSIFDTIKAATCRIEAAGSTGTGYLVSGNRIVTCHHVVERVGVGQTVSVTFHGHGASGAIVDTVSELGRPWDTAVLVWQTPAADITPLRFGRSTKRKTVWEGYGYPGLAVQGLPIDGTVDDVAGEDTRRVTSLVLTADKLAAGTGAPPHGFSGAPVVVDGLVIGHLKRIVEDPDSRRHVAFGTVYAARAEDFLKEVLPDEEWAPSGTAPSAAVPETGVDGFDVFLSASPADLPRASRLAQALRDRGRRVFFPLGDVVPGEDFKRTIARAIERSRAGVALVTPRWLRDAAGEGDALWARRDTSPFIMVPVISDGMGDELPSPWDNLRPIDMRGRDIVDAAFERLLYAINGESAPYEIVAKDLARTLTSADNPDVTAANARRLIAIGNPQKALDLLPRQSTTLEVRQLRALALSKSGNTDEAISILKGIQAEGALDGETGGILGGCYRRKYNKTKRKSYLDLALGAYQEAFERTGDPYPGINTAAILLQVGRPENARDVAQKVLASALAVAPGKADHWTHATIGEAQLILDNAAAARVAYERAAQDGVQLVQDVAMIRRGARRTLAALGRPSGELDDVFDVPRPVAFVGHGLDLPTQEKIRFPRSAAGDVRRAISDVLERRNSYLGIASATVGGDTIFLDEILSRDGYARVLLPCSEGKFLDYFVAQADRKYELRQLFRNPRAELIVVDDPSDPADLWSDFAPRLRDHAKAWGDALDEQPLLLALWDGQPSFLESVVNLWRERGWEVEEIALQNGRAVVPPRP